MVGESHTVASFEAVEHATLLTRVQRSAFAAAGGALGAGLLEVLEVAIEALVAGLGVVADSAPINTPIAKMVFHEKAFLAAMAVSAISTGRATFWTRVTLSEDLELHVRGLYQALSSEKTALSLTAMM